MRQYNPAALPEGGIFHGRYQIVRCIKAGGMGAVYEAIHLETCRRRALKVMLPSMVASDELRERFKLEARVAADIDSVHIVETFDAGVDQETGAPFLVMELLRGEELTAVLARRGRLPPDEAVQILAQAAKALDKTHAAGIVHRDIKPDNLFLAHRDDDPPRLKMLDFGIAKVVAQVTQADGSSRSVGTPVYMAPEQILGTRISPQTDLYALGHIAYQLLVGEAYWTEELELREAIYPMLLRVAQGPTEPAAARALRRREVVLSPAFEAWFARATAADPAARFERASTMIAAAAEALGVAAPPGALAQPPPQTPSTGEGDTVEQGARVGSTLELGEPSSRWRGPRAPPNPPSGIDEKEDVDREAGAAPKTQPSAVGSSEAVDPRSATMPQPPSGATTPLSSERSAPSPVRSRRRAVLYAAGGLAVTAAAAFALAHGPASTAGSETPAAVLPPAPGIAVAPATVGEPLGPPAQPGTTTAPPAVATAPSASTAAAPSASMAAAARAPHVPSARLSPRKPKDTLGF